MFCGPVHLRLGRNIMRFCLQISTSKNPDCMTTSELKLDGKSVVSAASQLMR